jgi:serine phosphatase RsbU (regulator of sigma subunit)
MALAVSKSKQLKRRAQAEQSSPSGNSWWYAHLLALVFLAALVTVDSGRVGTYMQTRITEPALFNLRKAMGHSPAVPSNLKILALDDATFAFLGAPKPSINDLSLLIENLQKRQPKAIIIDALMSDNPGDDVQSFKRLQSAAQHTFTGAFLSPYDIKYRNPLDVDKQAYKMTSYMVDRPTTNNQGTGGPQLSEKIGWRVYGPWQSLSQVFRSQGHLSYNSDGTISPFYRISENLIIPHISMYAADTIGLSKKDLFINRKKVTLTERGGIPINYRSPNQLYKKTYSLLDSLKRARGGRAETLVNPGDIVFIIFGFSTGSTDFHEFGPFGQIPGGFIVANMISDVELGTWLKRLEPSFLFIALAAILGVIIGINVTSRLFWLIVPVIISVAFCVTATLFIVENTIFPWLLPLIGFFGTAMIYFASSQLEEEFRYLQIEKSYYLEKNLRIEKEHERLKLEGYLSLGKTVQKLLLPPRLSDVFGDYKYTMYYNPSLKMAGDWLHIWHDKQGQLRIFMGDVVGKGPSAAIPVASIITILHDCQELDLDAEQTFKRLNYKLIEIYKGLVTTTAQAVILSKDNQCQIYNAGSNGWFLKNQDEAAAHIMRSTPLGLMSDLKIASKQIEITRQKEILFSFTDGYIESSRELRSFKRKLDTVRTNSLSVESLHQLLIDCQRNTEYRDDQTLLVIQRTSSMPLKHVG